VPAGLILAPQFIGVGPSRPASSPAHAFPSFKTVKQGVIERVAAAHPPPSTTFPTQYGLIVLGGIGMAILL